MAIIKIYGNFVNDTPGGYATDASQIKDLNFNKTQDQINAEKLNKIIPTTYADLKALRDNSQLIPGQQYRITDYECTTKQVETKSALHPFDIIVEAIEPNVLSENALAALHAGDDYFSTYGADLAAWELKYSLDNNTTKFTWALGDNDNHIQIEGRTFPRLTSADSAGSLRPYAWGWTNNDIIYTVSEEPEVGDLTYTSPTDTEEEGVAITAMPTGKGVIYWMKDEHDNELPYDFKNIMFRRYSIVGKISQFSNYYGCRNYASALPAGITAIDLSHFIWMYSLCMSVNDIADKSVVDATNAHDNVLDYTESTLGNNVFISTTYDNNIKIGCSCCTFMALRESSIDVKCEKNVILTGFRFHVGTELSLSSIISSAQNDGLTLGSRCNNLFLGIRTGKDISLGDGCADITIGSNSTYIKIGSGCTHITIGANCDYVEIGERAVSVTLGDSCDSIVIGNNSRQIIIPSHGNSLSFIKASGYVTITKEYTQKVDFVGSSFLTLTSSQTTSASNILRNLEFKHVGGTSSSDIKTISHDTVNDAFITTYQPANSQIISI